jgi:IS30 family transposase
MSVDFLVGLTQFFHLALIPLKQYNTLKSQHILLLAVDHDVSESWVNPTRKSTKGAFNRSAIGTVVERKTRFVILSKMQGCTANAALEGFTRQMKRLPVALRQSMTYDRGSEMACHPELSRRLKIDIWFCDPHAPWQRGSNENTNGLLRQFFPKGTDLSCLSQTALNDVARMMNHRPRKTLGWRTPAEAMAEELAAIKSTVALQS